MCMRCTYRDARQKKSIETDKENPRSTVGLFGGQSCLTVENLTGSCFRSALKGTNGRPCGREGQQDNGSWLHMYPNPNPGRENQPNTFAYRARRGAVL